MHINNCGNLSFRNITCPNVVNKCFGKKPICICVCFFFVCTADRPVIQCLLYEIHQSNLLTHIMNSSYLHSFRYLFCIEYDVWRGSDLIQLRTHWDDVGSFARTNVQSKRELKYPSWTTSCSMKLVGFRLSSFRIGFSGRLVLAYALVANAAS